MDQPTDRGLTSALNARRDILGVLLLAVLFGFTIATFSTLAVEHIKPGWILTTGCVVLVCVGFYALFRQLASQLTFADQIVAILMIDRENNKLIEVEDYEFVDTMWRTLTAVKAESRSIYSDWSENPLVASDDEHEDPSETDDANVAPKSSEDAGNSLMFVTRLPASDREVSKKSVSKSAHLAEEVALFSILKQMSFHLSAHFNRPLGVEPIELGRADMPQFLLQNRVLNLLSTPIDQRDIFLDSFPAGEKRPPGEIVYAIGPDGAVYEKFDLMLPDGSKINPKGHNGFSLATKRFQLDVEVMVTGFSSNISPRFAAYYLGSEWKNVRPIQVWIEITGRVKILGMLRSAGWDYYDWLDSFRLRLRRFASFDDFLTRISWDELEARIICSENMQSKPVRKPKLQASRSGQPKAGKVKGPPATEGSKA